MKCCFHCFLQLLIPCSHLLVQLAGRGGSLCASIATSEDRGDSAEALENFKENWENAASKNLNVCYKKHKLVSHWAKKAHLVSAENVQQDNNLRRKPTRR